MFLNLWYNIIIDIILGGHTMWKIITINKVGTNYSVSTEGQVKNINTNKILKGVIKDNGYREYQLVFDGKRKYVLGHRLVADAFIDNPENKLQVNHINGNKLDNSVGNLEWVSASENNKHAWDSSLNSANVLRAVIQKTAEGETVGEFISISEAERASGCHRSKIIAVADGSRKTTGGFVFEWKEQFTKKDIGKKKKVAQIKDDTIINTFESVSEAARETGSNRKGVSAVCLGKQNTCNGYKWIFVDDDIVQ